MGTIARILGRDLKRLAASPVALVVAVGVCLVPALYAWVNILANWDPYQSTSTVPVAVVVEDKGAEVPGMGEVNAGDMVRERLEENHQLGWTFVDQDEALEGVRAGRYYAAFVIPPDFTSTLAGVLDGHPTQARIGYYVNEKANAVAPKVTDTGATTLEDQIAGQFVSLAGETVTQRLQGAVGSAAGDVDGARSSALRSLRATQGRLDDLADSLEDAGGTVDAAREAVGRARETLSATADAAGGLASSMDSALGSLAGAREGLRSFARGLDDRLGEGASAISGLSSTAEPGHRPHRRGRGLGAGAPRRGALAPAGGKRRRGGHGGVAQGGARRGRLPRARRRRAARPPAAGGLRARRTGGASRGACQRAGLRPRRAPGDKQRGERRGQERGRARHLGKRRRPGGHGLARRPADGPRHRRGARALLRARRPRGRGRSPCRRHGLARADDRAGGRRARQLDALLAQSQSTLAKTANSLGGSADRMGALADDLAAVQSARALPAVGDVLSLDPASTGAALGSPVQMVDEPVFPVANYGSGVAPFYTNLALWVGGFVLVAIYKLEVDREGLGDVEVTPTQAFFGRWLLLALLGQVQALTCCVGDLALGVQCVSPVAFVLAGMAASLVYVLVVYSLAVALKHVGKALAVLLVVLQIPGASGLYPIQMQPAFFRALGPWLPFTYGIGAMREAVAGFYGANYARDLAVLALFAVPALLLGVVARRRLLGANALFDRKMAQTDLLVTERDGEKDAGRLALLVDALASSPAHREAFLARAARFELAYPRRVRRGVVALLAVPLALLALLFAHPAKLLLLSLWVVSLVAASAYLIWLEYVHERLAERAGLARMDRDELVALAEDAARAEKGGEAR